MGHDFQKPFRLPTGATEIVLVRHGSSARASENEMPLTDGHSDPPLSSAGFEQADALKEHLAGEQVEALFVTPRLRTAQTAAPLATRIDHEPIVVDDLREVHLGDREAGFNTGAPGPNPISAQVFEEGRWDVIPNAENMELFSERIGRGMTFVADQTGPDATGVAIVHAGVIAEACSQATQSHAFAFLYSENGSITRLIRLPSGRWAVRSFNDTSHLAALGR